jgi:hypothetical protein
MDFFSRRCFLREMPLLPDHKLAFLQNSESQEGGGMAEWLTGN